MSWGGGVERQAIVIVRITIEWLHDAQHYCRPEGLAEIRWRKKISILFDAKPFLSERCLSAVLVGPHNKELASYE